MGQVNLTATMDGLATLGATIQRNAYAYPVESVNVPCLMVGYPERIDFDMTFQRGGDAITLPIYYLVGKTGTKDARDALSAVVAGVGSIKTVFDGAQSFGAVRVEDAEVTTVTVGGVDYLAVKFTLDIRT